MAEAWRCAVIREAKNRKETGPKQQKNLNANCAYGSVAASASSSSVSWDQVGPSVPEHVEGATP